MSSDKYQRETVLVIEDDPGIAELEQMQLERAGFTVVTAGTSEEALDRLRRHHVDLLLLDYRLPGTLTASMSTSSAGRWASSCR